MKSPQFSRREYMAGVAGAAALRWDAEDYDIENVGEWDPLDGGVYQTGEFTPESVTASGEGTAACWMFDDSDFTERTVQVFYDHEAVNLDVEATADDCRDGVLANMTPEQARQLGAALFQAGEELERRREAEGNE